MKSKILLLVFLSISFANGFAQQWDGYTLIATQNSTTAILIDTNSNVYHTWTGLTGSTAYASYLLPGGILLRTVSATNNTFNGGGKTGRFQEVDWNGNILWDVTYSTTSYCMHHDILPMPNGNVIAIAWESKTGTQATTAGSSVSHTMWPDKIVEFQKTGVNTYNIVWEWHSWDHLMQNTNSSGSNYVSSLVNNPQLLNINYGNTSNQSDWLHMNGLDYNAALDQIVVSSHFMNEFYVLDHSTTTAEAAGHTGGNGGKGGDILYRWGNPAAYSGSGTTDFSTIHDAHWVPVGCPRAGYLVGFNNNGGANSKSAIDMVNPPLSGYNYTITAGQAFAPATYDYRFQTTDNTSNMGNSEQYPNGNQMICIALSSKVFEINAAGTTLWTYTATGGIPQAHRYSNCFINGPQSLTAAAADTIICAGATVQLSSTATGLGTYTYAWSSGASTQNTLVTPTTSTTYTVTATLVSGCIATASINVIVNSLPTANAGNDVTIAQGNSTTLTATGGTSYVWSNGANTASTSVSPTTTTTYTVTVTDVHGCTASDAVVVNVTGGVLTVNASATPNTICAGETIQLNASVGGGSGNYGYTWNSNPNGFSSSSQNPTATPVVNTVYTVTVNDGNTTATATVNVTVNQLPTASAGNNVNINNGSSTTLTATGGGTYLWNTGATTAGITVSPAVTTTYTVTVTNGTNCTATASVVVSVIGGPLSAVVSASDTTICNGETTQLFVTPSGGSGTYTYNWASVPSGFSSTLSNPYVTPTVTTIYLVTVNDGSNQVVETFTVTVNQLPAQPTITQTDTLLVSSSATNNQWYYYGALITGGTGQVLDPTLNGSYQVQIIDSNGCGSPLSNAYAYTQPTGINEIDFSSSVKLFPNPTNSIVILEGTALQNDFEITFYDQTGRIVMQNKNSKMMHVDELSAGIYFVSIHFLSGEKAFKRLVIAK